MQQAWCAVLITQQAEQNPGEQVVIMVNATLLACRKHYKEKEVGSLTAIRKVHLHD